MVDNSVLKEDEIRKLISEVSQEEVIEKESAISWDGRNLIIRIPREISDYLKIDEKNRFEKNFKFKITSIKNETRKEFEIVERTKPIREKIQNAITTKKTNKKNK
jgi:hypothetical protein